MLFEFAFPLAEFVKHFEALAALREALVVLLHVAEHEELVGVLETHLGIGVHPAVDNLHLVGADAVGNGQGSIEPVGELCSGSVSVGAPRVAENHGKVSRLITGSADLEPLAGHQRYILGPVWSWRSLGRTIHTVDCKVALVLGPLPVVYISAECGDANWRGRYEAHVRIYPIECKIILRSRPHRTERGHQSCGFLVALFDNIAKASHAELLTRQLLLLLYGLYFVGNVEDAF